MINFFLLGSLTSSLRNFRGTLIEAICATGAQTHAAAPKLSADITTHKWLQERAVTCHDVSLVRTGLRPAEDFNTLRHLTRLMREVRPDVFLGYTIKPVIWGLIAARLAGVPKRVALITGLGYAFTGQASGKRAVIQRIARMLYAFALRRATLIFFQNTDDRDDFARMGLLPKDVPVVVVNGSGVDLDSFTPAPLPDTPLRFLLIARLLGDKGIREYAAAAAVLRQRVPQVEFHLVGGLDPNPDGIVETEVQSWLDAGDVIWHGALSDVRPAIAAAHVYVLPSYREGTPRTVLEAMAMGRPIITTDAPGCRETVVNEDNGFLVTPRDTNSLVSAMERFVENPDLIPQMGRRARQIAEERYDVHKVNAVMLEAMGI